MATGTSRPARAGDSREGDWPGARLGLPESGPRSVARFGRRLGAIAIDWGISLLIAVVFFHYDLGGRTKASDVWLVPSIFAVLQVVFIALVSGSIGHLILGMRVVPIVPKWVGVWRPAVRTVLLCLLIPAFITDRDQRGLHDRAAGTVLVRR